MKTLRHISLIASYAVLAGGVAVYMLQWRTQVGEDTAVLGGALLFLSCALLHEIYGRIGRVSSLGRQFAAAMKTNAVYLEDLKLIEALSEAIGSEDLDVHDEQPAREPAAES